MSKHREKAVEAVEEALVRDTEMLDSEGHPMEDFDYVANVVVRAAEPHLQRMYEEKAGYKATRDLVDGWAQGELCPAAQETADAIARKALERFREAVLSKEARAAAVVAAGYFAGDLEEVKVPEAVMDAAVNGHPESWRETIEASVERALEQLREELEGDEATMAGAQAIATHGGPPGPSEKEKAAYSVNAALHFVLGDKEEGL